MAEVAPPPLDTALPRLVALFGVLRLPADTKPFPSEDKATGSFLVHLAPVLDQSCVSDNDFANLTLAVWCNAMIGTYRTQNNRVTSCFGGFWLGSLPICAILRMPTVP